MKISRKTVWLAALAATVCAFWAYFWVDGGWARPSPPASEKNGIVAWFGIVTFAMICAFAWANKTLRWLAGSIATILAFSFFLTVGCAGAFGLPDPTGAYGRDALTLVVNIWFGMFALICGIVGVIAWLRRTLP